MSFTAIHYRFVYRQLIAPRDLVSLMTTCRLALRCGKIYHIPYRLYLAGICGRTVPTDCEIIYYKFDFDIPMVFPVAPEIPLMSAPLRPPETVFRVRGNNSFAAKSLVCIGYYHLSTAHITLGHRMLADAGVPCPCIPIVAMKSYSLQDIRRVMDPFCGICRSAYLVLRAIKMKGAIATNFGAHDTSSRFLREIVHLPFSDIYRLGYHLTIEEAMNLLPLVKAKPTIVAEMNAAITEATIIRDVCVMFRISEYAGLVISEATMAAVAQKAAGFGYEDQVGNHSEPLYTIMRYIILTTTNEETLSTAVKLMRHCS